MWFFCHQNWVSSRFPPVINIGFYCIYFDLRWFKISHLINRKKPSSSLCIASFSSKSGIMGDSQCYPVKHDKVSLISPKTMQPGQFDIWQIPTWPHKLWILLCLVQFGPLMYTLIYHFCTNRTVLPSTQRLGRKHISDYHQSIKPSHFVFTE